MEVTQQRLILVGADYSDNQYGAAYLFSATSVFAVTQQFKLVSPNHMTSHDMM